jgi:hypothetical protein
MIDGLWTIAELEDLLVAKDVEMSALEKNWQDFEGAWAGFDKVGHDAWASDYATLKTRYGAARAVASAALLAAAILPDAVKKYAPADDPYRFVLLALQVHHDAVNPGDYLDLWNRLDAARRLQAQAVGAPPPPMIEPPVPTPRPGIDVDEGLIRSAPKLAWWASLLVLAAGSGAFYLLVGGGIATYLLRAPKRAHA